MRNNHSYGDCYCYRTVEVVTIFKLKEFHTSLFLYLNLDSFVLILLTYQFALSWVRSTQQRSLGEHLSLGTNELELMSMILSLKHM